GARMRGLELREKPYVVVNGDSLWKIAESIYGDASLWKRIFNANRDKVEDPGLIYPGQILNIP
ncbi:MAG: LysM peptidoglycan-binding domain-containing protein, partial [Candidatus Omnitrophica bacterium]|nr:LysM peptidoglycan-binding domain-containing protein [Candidatus Omnitrophota bacterium]